MMKQILGSMYKDREYLEKFLDESGKYCLLFKPLLGNEINTFTIHPVLTKSWHFSLVWDTTQYLKIFPRPDYVF